MKTLLPFILCLLLTACSKPTVSFFGVPIEGTLNEFLTAIDREGHNNKYLHIEKFSSPLTVKIAEKEEQETK